MIRRLALVAALGLLALSSGTQAAAARERPSILVIERQVMCVTCKIPLDVAESPQADREKAFIQHLIEAGQDESEIKRELVAQYGQTVLGLPAAKGFDLTVYLVPLAAVLLLLGTFLTLLPRWRRAARRQAAAESGGPKLGAADAARLDSDLARFD